MSRLPPCEACAIAKVNPHTGRFDSGCMECDARMVAKSIDVFDEREALQMGVMTKRYQDALQAVFGSGWMEGHKLVRAWVEKIKPGEVK